MHSLKHYCKQVVRIGGDPEKASVCSLGHNKSLEKERKLVNVFYTRNQIEEETLHRKTEE